MKEAIGYRPLNIMRMFNGRMFIGKFIMLILFFLVPKSYAQSPLLECEKRFPSAENNLLVRQAFEKIKSDNRDGFKLLNYLLNAHKAGNPGLNFNHVDQLISKFKVCTYTELIGCGVKEKDPPNVKENAEINKQHPAAAQRLIINGIFKSAFSCLNPDYLSSQNTTLETLSHDMVHELTHMVYDRTTTEIFSDYLGGNIDKDSRVLFAEIAQGSSAPLRVNSNSITGIDFALYHLLKEGGEVHAQVVSSSFRNNHSNNSSKPPFDVKTVLNNGIAAVSNYPVYQKDLSKAFSDFYDELGRLLTGKKERLLQLEDKSKRGMISENEKKILTQIQNEIQVIQNSVNTKSKYPKDFNVSAEVIARLKAYVSNLPSSPAEAHPTVPTLPKVVPGLSP